MSQEDIARQLDGAIEERNQKVRTALRILQLPPTDPVLKDKEMQIARLQAANLIAKLKQNSRYMPPQA